MEKLPACILTISWAVLSSYSLAQRGASVFAEDCSRAVCLEMLGSSLPAPSVSSLIHHLPEEPLSTNSRRCFSRASGRSSGSTFSLERKHGLVRVLFLKSDANTVTSCGTYGLCQGQARARSHHSAINFTERLIKTWSHRQLAVYPD